MNERWSVLLSIFWIKRANDAHVLMLMEPKNNTILTCKMHSSYNNSIQFNSWNFSTRHVSNHLLFHHFRAWSPPSLSLCLCVCVKAKIGVYVPEVGMRHLLYKHLYDALEALCFPFYFTWIRHTRTKAKQSLFSQWSVGITSNFISRKTGATC